MPIDYSKYPPNWKSEIVPAIKERSGDKCEVCGLRNKQAVYSIKLDVRTVVNSKSQYRSRSIWFREKADALREDMYNTIKEVKVVLTTAHLDHDELNWDVSLDRLAHLCQMCHLRYDAKEKWDRILEKSGMERKWTKKR